MDAWPPLGGCVYKVDKKMFKAGRLHLCPLLISVVVSFIHHLCISFCTIFNFDNFSLVKILFFNANQEKHPTLGSITLFQHKVKALDVDLLLLICCIVA